MDDDFPIISLKPEAFTREYIQRALEMLGMQASKREERDRALEEYETIVPSRSNDNIPNTQELEKTLGYLSDDAFMIDFLPRDALYKLRDKAFLEGIEKILAPHEKVLLEAHKHTQAERAKVFADYAQAPDLLVAAQYLQIVHRGVAGLVDKIRRHLEVGEIAVGEVPQSEGLVMVYHARKDNKAAINLLGIHAILISNLLDEISDTETKALLQEIKETVVKFAKNSASLEVTIKGLSGRIERVNAEAEKEQDPLIQILFLNVKSAIDFFNAKGK